MMQSSRARTVLFICQENRCRSATAERLFCKRPDMDVRSAGTSDEALVRVSGRMLDWADDIFIMDSLQRRALEEMFPGHAALQRLVCLDIPDDFVFLQPELVQLLTERAGPHLNMDCAKRGVLAEGGPSVMRSP